jgi:hypothetical protein
MPHHNGCPLIPKQKRPATPTESVPPGVRAGTVTTSCDYPPAAWIPKVIESYSNKPGTGQCHDDIGPRPGNDGITDFGIALEPKTHQT